MAVRKTIQCADCGSDVSTVRSNTKYCGFHRLYRDVLYVRGTNPRVVTCPISEQKFLPLHARQVVSTAELRLEHEPVLCYLCGEKRAPVSQHAMICAPCADDPDNNVRLLRALAEKDRWLQANPVKAPNR